MTLVLNISMLYLSSVSLYYYYSLVLFLSNAIEKDKAMVAHVVPIQGVLVHSPSGGNPCAYSNSLGTLEQEEP